MFAVLALAATVQSGEPAVAQQPTPGPASADVKTQLACPTPGKLIAKSPNAPANAFHTLNQEPDAAMIKPVARNYCDPNDVIRTNVSDRSPQKPTPIPARPPRIAR
jgi:hypothetical protein